MSTTKEHSADIPLAVWQLAPHGRSGKHDTLRCELARRVLDGYLPTGGTVLDINASDGDVSKAAVDAGAPTLVVAAPEQGGCLGPFDGTFDLAVALPSELALREGRPWQPREGSLDKTAARVRPGGVVVLCFIDGPIDEVADSAARRGLVYLQHVVALLPQPAVIESAGRQVGHADVLVFAKDCA